MPTETQTGKKLFQAFAALEFPTKHPPQSQRESLPGCTHLSGLHPLLHHTDHATEHHTSKAFRTRKSSNVMIGAGQDGKVLRKSTLQGPPTLSFWSLRFPHICVKMEQG